MLCDFVANSNRKQYSYFNPTVDENAWCMCHQNLITKRYRFNNDTVFKKVIVGDAKPALSIYNKMKSNNIVNDIRDFAELFKLLDDDERQWLSDARHEIDRIELLKTWDSSNNVFFSLKEYVKKVEYYGPCTNEAYNTTDDSLSSRYYIATYVSRVAAMIEIFTNNDLLDNYKIYAIHNFLFARPYRKDWSECSVNTMKDELQSLENICESCLSVVHNDMRAPNELQRIIIFIDFIKKYHSICDYVGYLENCKTLIPENTKSEGTKFISGIDLEDLGWFVKCTNATNLPDSIAALTANKNSNAFIPAFAVKDTCQMVILLVPCTAKVWNVLHHVYGIPKHDAMYPEKEIVASMLIPENTEFPLLVCDTFDYLVYGGEVNLCDYLENTDGMDRESNDYRFYTFYVRGE